MHGSANFLCVLRANLKSKFLNVEMRITLLILLMSGASMLSAQSRPNDYLVGAHYYAWYNKSSWNRIAGEPLLGHYTSKDRKVISQHIRWAHQYGVDFFAIGWSGQEKSTNDVIRKVFLTSPDIRRIRFCIAYDTLTRFRRIMDPPFDFSNPALYREFISDFEYLSRTYFSHPQYLKFGGRPVVWLYLGRGMQGDWVKALDGARAAVKKNGFDLYLDGDLLWPERTDISRLPYFDAASAYVVNQKEMFRKEGIQTTGEVVSLASSVFNEWTQIVPSVKNIRTGAPVAFHPVINPQFIKPADPAALRYSLQDIDEFRSFAELARNTATYSQAAGAKVIWITSWNEWYEGTAIEPTYNGPSLENNYGFQLLEVIRQVFK